MPPWSASVTTLCGGGSKFFNIIDETVGIKAMLSTVNGFQKLQVNHQQLNSSKQTDFFISTFVWFIQKFAQVLRSTKVLVLKLWK